MGMGLAVLCVAELGLRAAGVAEGEHWAPPQLVTIVQDGQIQGEFEITENFFCKVNINAPDCQAGDISVQDPGWLFGVNSQVGAGVKLYRELYLLVAGSFSFVVFPLSEPPLDFPVGFDVGLEYRF